MADPVLFARSFSYTSFEGVNPAAPKPGSALDAEMNAVAASIGSVAEALADVRRTDGALKNATVTPDSFTTTALKLMAGSWIPRGAWVTATAYVVGDVVTVGTATYVANTAHTAAALFSTDTAADRWNIIAETVTFAGAAPAVPLLGDVGKAVVATAPGVLGYTTIYSSHSTLPGTTPINKGGTGATSASGALTNLGAAAAADLAATNVAVGVINSTLPGKANLAGATFTGAISLPAAAAAPAEAVRLDQAQAIPGLQFVSGATLASPATAIVVAVPAAGAFMFELRLDAADASTGTPLMEVSVDGGATYLATGATGAVYAHDLSAGATGDTLAGAGRVLLAVPARINGGTDAGVWGALHLENVAGLAKRVWFHGGWQVNNGINTGISHTAARLATTGTITHVRFRTTTDDPLQAGSFVRLYRKRTS